MKNRDIFWCIAVFCGLLAIVLIKVIPDYAAAGISGGICAAVCALLFGCGLKSEQKNKDELLQKEEEEKKKTEIIKQEEVKQLKKIQSALRDAKGEISQEIATACDKLDNLGEKLDSAYGKFAETEENLKALLMKLSSAEEALKSLNGRVENAANSADKHFKESFAFYSFMTSLDLSRINEISGEILPEAADRLSELEIISGKLSEMKASVNKLASETADNNELLSEKLDEVCKRFEEEGASNREALNNLSKMYSEISDRDLEALTALTEDMKRNNRS